MSATASAADVSPPDGRYEPFIDGVRGILAFYMVLYHITLTTCYLFGEGEPEDHYALFRIFYYGFDTVTAFIFVSGFCLGMPVVRRLDRGGAALPRGVLAFYRARAWRILPAYYAVLAIGVIVGSTALSSGQEFPAGYMLPVRPAAVIGSVLLVPNLVDPHNGVGVIWSLGVELRIYLLFPLMCAVWRRCGLGVMVGLVCGGVAFALRYLPHAVGPLVLNGDNISGLSPPLYVTFATGLVAATLFAGAGPRVRLLRERGPWLLVLLVMIAACGVSGRGISLGLGDAARRYAVGVLMLLVVMSVRRHRWLRWPLERRPLLHLGTISYSLYLTHLILFTLVYLCVYRPLFPDPSPESHLRASVFVFIVGLPPMLAVAFVIAKYLEWPFMGDRSRRAATARINT